LERQWNLFAGRSLKHTFWETKQRQTFNTNLRGRCRCGGCGDSGPAQKILLTERQRRLFCKTLSHGFRPTSGRQPASSVDGCNGFTRPSDLARQHGDANWIKRSSTSGGSLKLSSRLSDKTFKAAAFINGGEVSLACSSERLACRLHRHLRGCTKFSAGEQLALCARLRPNSRSFWLLTTSAFKQIGGFQRSSNATHTTECTTKHSASASSDECRLAVLFNDVRRKRLPVRSIKLATELRIKDSLLSKLGCTFSKRFRRSAFGSASGYRANARTGCTFTGFDNRIFEERREATGNDAIG
jgi:hypothetical protein